MAIPAIKSVTFGIEVSDLATSTKWYETFLGSAAQSPDEGIIEFELAPGTYLMLSSHAPETAVDGSVNLQVDDIEAAKRAVEELGVASGPIEHVPGVLAYFEVKDPDGHIVTLLELTEGA